MQIDVSKNYFLPLKMSLYQLKCFVIVDASILVQLSSEREAGLNDGVDLGNPGAVSDCCVLQEILMTPLPIINFATKLGTNILFVIWLDKILNSSFKELHSGLSQTTTCYTRAESMGSRSMKVCCCRQITQVWWHMPKIPAPRRLM